MLLTVNIILIIRVFGIHYQIYIRVKFTFSNNHSELIPKRRRYRMLKLRPRVLGRRKRQCGLLKGAIGLYINRRTSLIQRRRWKRKKRPNVRFLNLDLEIWILNIVSTPSFLNTIVTTFKFTSYSYQ